MTAPTSTTDTGTQRLKRLRDVPVPITGEVMVRGRARPVTGRPAKRTVLARRYAVVHHTDGPHVRLGIAWFVLIVAALALDWPAVTAVYAIAAGWAALEVARRRREAPGGREDVRIAALGAAGVGASGALGTGAMGIALLLLVLITLVVGAWAGHRGLSLLAGAGATVQSAALVGLAAACVVRTVDLEIGAAATLLLFVSAFEVGDYLIGSGSSNSVEGPLAGGVTVLVVTLAIVALSIPPFEGAPAFTFAAMAIVCCPLGQLVASALLPAVDARAPALRRIDSLLVLAPVWVWTVGIFIERSA